MHSKEDGPPMAMLHISWLRGFIKLACDLAMARHGRFWWHGWHRIASSWSSLATWASGGMGGIEHSASNLCYVE